ncbi:hypothetical protein V6N13_004786 [Hibiscus sabdariffa]
MIFSNYLSLNQASIDDIVANTMLKIESIAEKWARSPNKLICCFPGNEIPPRSVYAAAQGDQSGTGYKDRCAGKYTRLNFTSHLLKALETTGMSVFFDEDALEKRELLSPTLSRGIAASRFSIIVLSINYAISKIMFG